ncbi:monovalent cation/H(+) antiporter subunit G [Tenuifilum sp.]|uniref:monovalent cation/H(+) antiporter subunit G n=1 Tax=Tenuifilum sp. TaxID=2760880 RepID=UPI002C7967D8|nr:monovalent cation/H(+) antiporter subunit G [Tenuifilum sp.]HOK84824.1 monovalent cation/H(+) antiporter subunit G [Tenuifilum sp.]HPP89077.1 monovalent cation/H(+) antiporter subunit G [Tenuifilum sp.]
MEIRELIGASVTLVGSIFIFLGGLGIVRMPDLFNRIQAGTKASTLGTILSLIGLAIVNPAWIWKLLVIMFFVLITNPVSSNVISRAAHFRGTKMTDKTVADLLVESENKTEEE